MAKKFGELKATISADTTNWKASLDRASKDAEGFKDKVGRSIDSVTGAANELSPAMGNALDNIGKMITESGAGLTMALAAAAGGFVALTKRSVDSAQAFEDFRDQTQLSVAELAKFEYVAIKNGTSLDEFGSAIVKMQKALREAKNGSQDAAITFAKLGVNIDEAMQDKDGGVSRVANAIAKLSDATLRQEIVTELFGKAGAKMNATINDISDGVEKATNRSEAAQTEFDNFYKTLNEVSAAAGSAADAISVRIVYSLNVLMDKLSSASELAGGYWSKIVNAPIGKSTIAKTSGSIFENMFGSFGDKKQQYIDDNRLSSGVIGGASYQKKLKEKEEEDKKQEQISQRAINRNAVYKAGLAELKKQLDDGKLSQAQFNQKVKDYNDNFNKVDSKSTPKDKVIKEKFTEYQTGADMGKEYGSILDDLNAKSIELDLSTLDLSESQKKLAIAMNSDAFIRMPEEWKKIIAAQAEDFLQKEQQIKANIELQKSIDDFKKSQLDAQESVIGLTSAQKKLNEILRSDAYANATQEVKDKIIQTAEATIAQEKYNEQLSRARELAGLDNAGRDKNQIRKDDLSIIDNAFKNGDINQEQYDKAKETITGIKDSIFDMKLVANDAAKGIADAFMSFAEKGKSSFADFARSFLANIGKMIIQASILKAMQTSLNAAAGVSGWVGTVAKAMGGVASANGNVFAPGTGGPALVPFASGGVFSSPITFPMSGGKTGLLGEAGPEAVMPLTRIGGKLGVRAVGGSGATNVVQQVTVNVQASAGDNADQLGAKVSEAVMRSLAQQEIVKATRTGGILNRI